MQSGRRGAFSGSGAATIASATVLVVASLVVGLGVMWWIGHTITGAAVGAMVGGACGLLILIAFEEVVDMATQPGSDWLRADEEKDEPDKGSNG
jgi:hypothetical protein